MLRADWVPPDWAHWVDLTDGAVAASTPGLTVVVWRDGPRDAPEEDPNVWRCTAWRKNKGRLDMTPSPVWLDLARRIGEDLLRRAGGAKIAKKDASWRERPATEGQIAALRRFGVTELDFTMSRGEAGADVERDAYRLEQRELLAATEQRREALAFDELHREEAVAAVFADVEGARVVTVRHAPRQLHLASEPLEHRARRGELFLQDLGRDELVELAIARASRVGDREAFDDAVERAFAQLEASLAAQAARAPWPGLDAEARGRFVARVETLTERAYELDLRKSFGATLGGFFRDYLIGNPLMDRTIEARRRVRVAAEPSDEHALGMRLALKLRRAEAERVRAEAEARGDL
jgi:hypothetical protein